ncbi:putative transcription initiation factor IIA, gamma subunit, transcription factor IIA, helical [Helianthus annuus]|nr:putative transcription initiation factor IIA, gamma subunit, transcription factor IIA, helical [Helianthus annuus]
MLSQSIYIKAELQKLGYKKQISFSLFRTSTTRKKNSHAYGDNLINRSFMATFELYRRSTIGMCLTETLDEMVSSGILGPELAIQVLVQFDKSMAEALDTQVKTKVSIKGHLHTYRFCDNVWTFILQDALFKYDEFQENVGRVKIVACDSKLLVQ